MRLCLNPFGPLSVQGMELQTPSPLLLPPGPAHLLPSALQEGGDGYCLPRRRGALRRDPGLLLPGGARPVSDEAFCGHRCGHPALPQRCVPEAADGPSVAYDRPLPSPSLGPGLPPRVGSCPWGPARASHSCRRDVLLPKHLVTFEKGLASLSILLKVCEVTDMK